MFAYLKGVFESRTLDYIVVDVNGIGYKILGAYQVYQI